MPSAKYSVQRHKGLSTLPSKACSNITIRYRTANRFLFRQPSTKFLQLLRSFVVAPWRISRQYNLILLLLLLLIHLPLACFLTCGLQALVRVEEYHGRLWMQNKCRYEFSCAIVATACHSCSQATRARGCRSFFRFRFRRRLRG